MPDLSFKCWHVAIICDHPEHRREQLQQERGEPDFYDVEPDAARRDWRDEWRGRGFIFHRDGQVTCPECAALAKQEQS